MNFLVLFILLLCSGTCVQADEEVPRDLPDNDVGSLLQVAATPKATEPQPLLADFSIARLLVCCAAIFFGALFSDLRNRRLYSKGKLLASATADAKAEPTPQAKKAAEARLMVDNVLQATTLGDLEALEVLFRANSGTRRSLAQTTDAWGCTALHYTADKGHEKVANLLLRHGAEVDAQDACGETPLHFAARGGHVELCHLLLDHGASNSVISDQGWTPLVEAGVAGHRPVCRLLLDAGAHAGGAADSELPGLLVAMFIEKVMTGPRENPQEGVSGHRRCG